MARRSFGEFFKEKRIKKGMTLREFCLKYKFDPGNISKLERGKMNPPGSQEKLVRYAKALGIKHNSDDWIEFLDRASACRGEIPEELLSDEELVAKLPVVFRTLRGDKVSKKKMNELAETIRKA